MGGVVWSQTARPAETTQTNSVETPNESVAVQDGISSDLERKAKLEEEMQKFKEEMAKKREARTEAIQNLNKRIVELQEERDREHDEKVKLREELQKLRVGSGAKEFERKEGVLLRGEGGAAAKEEEEEQKVVENQELSDEDKVEGIGRQDEEQNKETSAIVQNVPDEDGIDEHDKDEVIEGLERQVKALKDVAVIGGEMLKIRELQVNELKSKLEAIEETGIAYEKEVENMKKLRNLYEERARAMTISHEMELEREKQKALAAEARQKLAEHKNSELEEKNKETEERMGKIEGELDEAKTQISDLKIKVAGKSEDLYTATSQLAVVNHLFGQLFSPGQDSVGKITKVLEEHHDLVNHLTANGKINELASTLVDIADKDPLPLGGENDMSGHLTKVWRLLVELLGHHIVKPAPEEASPDSCYKSVDTPSGPKMVISVSQTFLRLKDLILEKNSLMKEVGRLKDLNCTLESRLEEQENRLSLVTTELHTTWAVVNKLKRQHQNLHSHEQVLRYELAQKRLLLNDLKKQLEECKENWTLARAKNSQTERDWKLLRSEFALRKQQASSAESGYEESPTDSQDEEEWKDVKNQSVSSDEDHCEVLSWNDTVEPRTDRRGTLTNVSENDETPRGFMDFSADDVDPCTVLPWTDPEESSAENSVSEDSRNPHRSTPEVSTAESSTHHPCLGHSPTVRQSDLPESAPGLVLSSRLSGQSTPHMEDPSPAVVVSPEDHVTSTFSQNKCLSIDHPASGLASTSREISTLNSASESGCNVSSSSTNDSSGLTEGLPSTSMSEPSTSQPRQRTAEEILQARQDRLQRLEEGCKGLFSKMSQTNQRSEVIKSRLTELHEIYGEESRIRRESPLPDIPGPSSEPTTEPIAEFLLRPESSRTSSTEPGTVPVTESVLDTTAAIPPAVAATAATTSTINPPPPPPPFPHHRLYLPQHPTSPENPVRPENTDDSNR